MVSYFSANQETLAALAQFFSTAFSSGESAASFGDLPTVPEEPAMDSYQPQADVSHVLAELTEILTHFFALQQVKRLFVRKWLKLYWMNYIVLSCSITFTPPPPPFSRHHYYLTRLHFRLSGAVVRCHRSDCII